LSGVFADRLIGAVRRQGPLCVGVDPHPDLIPSLFGPPGANSALAWGRAVVEQCAGRVTLIKPQAGLFERWGSKGVAALESVCAAAREAGLIVLLDAKRGDIGTTAEGYAEGYLGAGSSCWCDAITVNPYMGIDTIEPFVTVAERQNKGVAVLARTSNPGAADFQAKLIDGEPLYIRVAQALAPMIRRLKGKSGWSGLMLVAGATGPGDAARLRAAATDAIFLVPGYGVQGAAARDALAGFVAGPTGLEGGVVNASRSATAPEAARSAACVRDWERAVSQAVEQAQAELLAASRGQISEAATRP
jgi:orotidine-5'-phosphate decarboxylase